MTLAVISVVVASAAGLAIVLGGGPDGRPSSSPFPSGIAAVSAAPNVNGSPIGSGPPPVSAPSLRVTFPPIATESPTLSASPTDGRGIRANRIQIVRLGIDLKIVEGDGVDAPIGKAAHYPGSGWPGGGTNIYIYAHARAGMFLSLWDVKFGDEVVLTLVDGTARTYVVARVLPQVPWNALTYLAPTPTEQLTLQTSTSYHATSPRFIALAYPAP